MAVFSLKELATREFFGILKNEVIRPLAEIYNTEWAKFERNKKNAKVSKWGTFTLTRFLTNFYRTYVCPLIEEKFHHAFYSPTMNSILRNLQTYVASLFLMNEDQVMGQIGQLMCIHPSILELNTLLMPFQNESTVGMISGFRDEFLVKFKKITIFKTSDYALTRRFLFLKNLQNLMELCIFSVATNSLLEAVTQACPNLTILDLSHSKYVNDDSLYYIRRYLCKLEIFTVEGTNVSAYGIAKLCTTLDSLSQVPNLDFVYVLDALKTMGEQNSSNVTVIKLGEDEGQEPVAVDYCDLFTYFPKIQELNLGQCFLNVSNRDLRLEFLRSLKCYHCLIVSDAFINLHQNQIRDLTVKFCGDIESVYAFAEKFRVLQSCNGMRWEKSLTIFRLIYTESLTSRMFHNNMWG